MTHNTSAPLSDRTRAGAQHDPIRAALRLYCIDCGYTFETETRLKFCPSCDMVALVDALPGSWDDDMAAAVERAARGGEG